MEPFLNYIKMSTQRINDTVNNEFSFLLFDT